MRYKAVFFDFDYTLGDATESIAAGFDYAFEKMGWPKPPLEGVKRTVGLMLRDGYTMLTGDADPARRERFTALFTEKSRPMQAATTRLLPGARALLEGLRAAGVRAGIVSSKRDAALVPILERQGVRPLLDFTVGGDMVRCPKPAPEGILLGMARVGVRPEETLYCGDTVLDAEAAQRAGTHFAAVLTGVTPAADFQPYPHARLCPDLWDLKNWLAV